MSPPTEVAGRVPGDDVLDHPFQRELRDRGQQDGCGETETSQRAATIATDGSDHETPSCWKGHSTGIQGAGKVVDGVKDGLFDPGHRAVAHGHHARTEDGHADSESDEVCAASPVSGDRSGRRSGHGSDPTPAHLRRAHVSAQALGRCGRLVAATRRGRELGALARRWFGSCRCIARLPLVPPLGWRDARRRAPTLRDRAVTVGSFDFAESLLLAELYSQALERGASRTASVRSRTREFVAPASLAAWWSSSPSTRERRFGS